jgi:hypothetical protein
MRTDCIVKLSKLKIFELNTSGHVEGDLLLRTLLNESTLGSGTSICTARSLS